LGFDCIFLDAEHGGLSPAMAKDMVRAADLAGVPSLVRVPRNEPAIMLSYLDIGTGGVVVPHIKTAEEAEAAVAAAYFGPRGTRGAHAGTRAANYGVKHSAAEYFAQANEQLVVAAMIEDLQGVEQIERICAVDGIDLCLVGREDLAMSLGFPGVSNHPEVNKLAELVLRIGRAKKMAVGITTPDAAAVLGLFEKGYQFVVVSAARLLARASDDLLTEVGAIKRTPAGA
jgi:2-keto-3-deoxy-L-rhamnonate aldolase RhmA